MLPVSKPNLMLRLFGTLACCGFVGVLSGCGDAPQAAEPPPPKVTVAHPETRTLTDYDEYNGRTAPSETVEIRARVRGHIMEVHFKDGDTVEEGQPLFQLDPQPFEAEIGRAEGQLGIAEAQHEEAVAQRDEALTEEARIKRIFDRDAATLQEYERAQAVAKSKEASVKAALAQIKAAKDEVSRRKLDETFAKITAPIGGKIGRAMMTVGNLVNAGLGDPVLTTIVKLDPIYVFFNVDERSLIRYRERRKQAEGKQLKSVEEAKIPFEFRLENDEGFPHKGMLDFADNRIDPTTGTIEIRGKVDNPDGRFIPGGRVRVRVAVSEPYEAILVPDTAVLSDQDKKYLLCLNEKDVVIRKDVKLGRLLDDGMRVILPADEKENGLTSTDRVIVVGLQRARINYPVEPMDAEGNEVSESD